MTDLTKLSDEELVEQATLIYNSQIHDLPGIRVELLRRLSLPKWHRFDDPAHEPPKDGTVFELATDNKPFALYELARFDPKKGYWVDKDYHTFDSRMYKYWRNITPPEPEDSHD